MLQAIIVEQAFIHGSGNLIKLLISCMTNIQLNCTVDDKNLAKVGPALELADFCLKFRQNLEPSHDGNTIRQEKLKFHLTFN